MLGKGLQICCRSVSRTCVGTLSCQRTVLFPVSLTVCTDWYGLKLFIIFKFSTGCSTCSTSWISQLSDNMDLFYPLFSDIFLGVCVSCGVHGREVELPPRNLEVPILIPGSGCQFWDFFIGTLIWRQYWCSSQKAESREISISCLELVSQSM